jgi:hypothetical protein
MEILMSPDAFPSSANGAGVNLVISPGDGKVVDVSDFTIQTKKGNRHEKVFVGLSPESLLLIYGKQSLQVNLCAKGGQSRKLFLLASKNGPKSDVN